jgi:hypothetical protein
VVGDTVVVAQISLIGAKGRALGRERGAGASCQLGCVGAGRAQHVGNLSVVVGAVDQGGRKIDEIEGAFEGHLRIGVGERPRDRVMQRRQAAHKTRNAVSIDEARAALETLDFGVDLGRRRGGAGLARHRDQQGPRQCSIMLGGIEQARRQPFRPQLYQGFRGERLRFRYRFARET